MISLPEGMRTAMTGVTLWRRHCLIYRVCKLILVFLLSIERHLFLTAVTTEWMKAHFVASKKVDIDLRWNHDLEVKYVCHDLRGTL